MTDDAGHFETSVLPGEQTISVVCAEAGLKGEIILDIPASGNDDLSITVQ